MADVTINIGDPNSGKASIANDFMFANNVAQANIYIRMGFLRKVYGILTVQILLTTVIAAVAMLTPMIKFYINENDWLLTVAFLLSLVLLLALMVKRHETPLNYILLTAFTTVEAYTVAVVVTYYDQMAVLQALILTLSVVFALTAYTLQSKKDFSTWGAGLFSVLWVLIIAGLLQMFIRSNELELLMAVGGAVVFSMFIIYDTHALMHRHSPEEYILAVINLYLDIINLFMHILRIIGHARKQ